MMKSHFDKLIDYNFLRAIRNANYIFAILQFRECDFPKSRIAEFRRKVVMIKIKTRRNPN